MRGVLVPGIVGQWREAVHEDVAADPFSRGEDAVRGRDDATIAYGTTLLLAIAWGEWLLLTQIGDGDIVGIRPDGTALLPVPGDPQLDGRHTTSLCMPGAENSFRAGAVDTSRTALLGVLLATDGYGNAQVARDWEAAVSADLAGLIATTRRSGWPASCRCGRPGVRRWTEARTTRPSRWCSRRAARRRGPCRRPYDPDPRLSLEGRALRMVRTGTQVSVGPRLGEGRL